MNLDNITETNIGKMIGDIRNLDWMDLENLNNDVTIGSSINDSNCFLVIKYEIRISSFKTIKGAQCFFRPYLHHKDFWISNDNSLSFIKTEPMVTANQFILINNLIKKKIVTLHRYHYPLENKYIGKKIALQGVWKIKKAIDIIEKNWLICRYEPKYKMCEQVLMNNIEEAREEYLNSL